MKSKFDFIGEECKQTGEVAVCGLESTLVNGRYTVSTSLRRRLVDAVYRPFPWKTGRACLERNLFDAKGQNPWGWKAIQYGTVQLLMKSMWRSYSGSLYRVLALHERYPGAGYSIFHERDIFPHRLILYCIAIAIRSRVLYRNRTVVWAVALYTTHFACICIRLDGLACTR